MESLRNAHVEYVELGQVELPSPNSWLDASLSSVASSFSPLQLSLSPSNALPTLHTVTTMSPSQFLESSVVLNDLLCPFPINVQPFSVYSVDSVSHPLLPSRSCSNSHTNHSAHTNHADHNHTNFAYGADSSISDTHNSERNNPNAIGNYEPSSSNNSVMVPTYDPSSVTQPNNSTSYQLIPAMCNDEKPVKSEPTASNDLTKQPKQPNNPLPIPNCSAPLDPHTSISTSEVLTIPPSLIRKNMAQQPHVIRATFIPPTAPTIPPQQLHQPHIATIPNTISIPSPGLYAKSQPDPKQANGAKNCGSLDSTTNTCSTTAAAYTSSACPTKGTNECGENGCEMMSSDTTTALLSAMIKNPEIAENLLNTFSKKYRTNNHTTNTAIPTTLLLPVPPPAANQPSNPGCGNGHANGNGNDKGTAGSGSNGGTTKNNQSHNQSSPVMNTTININNNIHVNNKKRHTTNTVHNNNHTTIHRGCNGCDNSKQDNNSNDTINSSNSNRNSRSRTSRNKYSLLVHTSNMGTQSSRKRQIDSDGSLTPCKSDRKTRPKVVASKGAVQCIGKNRKMGTRCRNAALMEYIGPAPLYCAEHIELDPDSLYCKCKSSWHKSIGDGKRCKEVVLKEFAMCHKHIKDVLDLLNNKEGFDTVAKYLDRASKLLANLETEASGAKKTDADLFQRKNKLIPKFHEMRQHILHKYKELESTWAMAKEE